MCVCVCVCVEHIAGSLEYFQQISENVFCFGKKYQDRVEMGFALRAEPQETGRRSGKEGTSVFVLFMNMK